MKNKIIFLCMIFLTKIALSNTSEMMFQPKANKFIFESTLSYYQNSINGKAMTGVTTDSNGNSIIQTEKTKQKISDLGLALNGKYGVNDNLALSFGLGYGTSDLEIEARGLSQTDDLNGLNPFILGLQFFSNLGIGKLYTKGEVYWGPNDSDRAADSVAFILGLTYEFQLINGDIGFYFNYLFPITETKLIDSSYNIGTYYEFSNNSLNIYGIALSYNFGSNIFNPNYQTLNSALNIDDGAVLHAKAYGKINITKKLKFIPGINITSIISSKENNIYHNKSSFGWGLNTGIRYHF